MERRIEERERRKNDVPVASERRSKPRRKGRKLVGSATIDQTRIDVSDGEQLQYWCEELDVSPEILRTAVQQAGSTLGAVRQHLRGGET
jgi:hypothetical protein